MATALTTCKGPTASVEAAAVTGVAIDIAPAVRAREVGKATAEGRAGRAGGLRAVTACLFPVRQALWGVYFPAVVFGHVSWLAPGSDTAAEVLALSQQHGFVNAIKAEPHCNFQGRRDTHSSPPVAVGADNFATRPAMAFDREGSELARAVEAVGPLVHLDPVLFAKQANARQGRLVVQDGLQSLLLIDVVG